MIVHFAFKQRLKIQLFENDGESKEKLIILYISTKLPGLLVYSMLKIIVQLQMYLVDPLQLGYLSIKTNISEHRRYPLRSTQAEYKIDFSQ